MSSRRGDKKSDVDKNINYKNLISQYYEKDPQLRDVSDKLTSDFPQIQILQTLTDFQKKMDTLIKNKRYDVQQIFVKPAQKLKRVLRIHIFYQKGETQNILKVGGGLYPPKSDNMSDEVVMIPKFSSFFKQISFFYLNENQPFETWKKPPGNFIQQDGFLIRLPKTNEQQGIIIKFNLINNPPKFQVESSLQKIVGMKKGTRVQILDAFWEYVKENKLQDIENKEIINADDKLKNTFKVQKFAFATVNNKIRELLAPVQPFSAIIKPNEEMKTYDMIIEIEERPDVDIVPFFAQKLNEQKNDHPYLSLNGKIKKLQKKFQDHSQKLRRHLAKRNLYMDFTSDKIQAIILEQHYLLGKLKQLSQKKSPATEGYNKLSFILDNEQEVEKQIKHYYESLNILGNNNGTL